VGVGKGEKGLFNAKAMNEVDAGCDRATPVGGFGDTEE
jgi:hypothetical protein